MGLRYGIMVSNVLGENLPDWPVRIAYLYRQCYNARMNTTLKITKIGNSAGVILPKDVLEHLDVIMGEDVVILKTLRGIELARPDGDFEEQMKAARDVMTRRKRALRELAK